MKNKIIRILYLHGDLEDFSCVKSNLNKTEHLQFEWVEIANDQEPLPQVKNPIDIYLVDYRQGNPSVSKLLTEIQKENPDTPVIILSDGNIPGKDDVIPNSGKSYYLTGGEINPYTLIKTINYALRDLELRDNLLNVTKKFKNIYERAADPIVLIDEDALVVDANPSFIARFGYYPMDKDRDKIYFSDFFVDKEDRNRFIQVLKTKIKVNDFHTKLRIPDSCVIESLLSIVQLESDLECYQVLIKDLTSLRAKEEAEHNLKKFSSTGRIAKLLAHEVKNPLTTILLSSDQLRCELPDDVLKQSGELLNIIKKNCERINHQVTQLLDSTKFSELNIGQHSINHLLDDALKEVKDRIGFNGIKVYKNYDHDICKINVDAEKVKIALVNLLVNAVEAMEPEQGKLKLQTKASDNKCHITISDNGNGIRLDHIDRLFEPYFTNKRGGTGLGLTNTQNIILSHGGNIKVKSAPHIGTTFHISFNLN